MIEQAIMQKNNELMVRLCKSSGVPPPSRDSAKAQWRNATRQRARRDGGAWIEEISDDHPLVTGSSASAHNAKEAAVSSLGHLKGHTQEKRKGKGKGKGKWKGEGNGKGRGKRAADDRIEKRQDGGKDGDGGGLKKRRRMSSYSTTQHDREMVHWRVSLSLSNLE